MSNYYIDEFENVFNENQNDFTSRHSLMFLVEGTEDMYKKGYFTKCVKTYKNIVRKKCSKNKQDKMGFVIFGTNETNCGVTNLMTLQEFDTVSVDTLKYANSILKDGIDKYKPTDSLNSHHVLYDALSYAYQKIHNSKTNERYNNIILLCTSNDNPCYDMPNERQRIRQLVATFKDTKTELCVIGFSDSWNDVIFYKDLQIISGTFSNNDYTRTFLKNFEQNVLNPAKSICTIPWKISPNISVKVSLYNIISFSRYPSKIKLNKNENEILESRRFLHKGNMKETQSQNLNETKNERKVIRDNSIVYYKMYACLNIYFKPFEHKKLKNMCLEPCIELLVFKPIMCDPLYHSRPAYFITSNLSCDYDDEDFFMSFVSKCADKSVMPVCKVVTKLSVAICIMIPSKDDGGFYMYRMPYSNNVRDLDNLLRNYIFNSKNKCPINEEAVDLFKKLMDFSKIKFNPTFTNPKIEKCIAHIEALALDEKLNTLPPDNTLPPPMKSGSENLKATLKNLLNLPDNVSNKRKNSKDLHDAKRLKINIMDLIRNKELDTLRVVDLKEFLKSINKSTQGNKSNLIERIYKHVKC